MTLYYRVLHDPMQLIKDSTRP